MWAPGPGLSRGREQSSAPSQCWGLSKTVLVSKFWSYKQTQFSNSWHSLWIANGERGLETATEKADIQTDLVILVKHIFRKEVGSQHILKKVSS